MNNNETGKYFKLKPDDNDVSFLNIMGSDPCSKDRIILDREKLKFVIGLFKKEGLTIVYTSGVYDLLHDGHVKYLAAAKALGDFLIVGVDDDELTRQRKPDEKNRPIDSLDVRLITLVHNRSINVLTVRTNKEPLEQLVKDILPDIAVFSRSTKDTAKFEEDIHNALDEYCGEIVFLDPQSTNSTTAKIRKVSGNGAHEMAMHLAKKLDGLVDPKKLEVEINNFYNQENNNT